MPKTVKVLFGEREYAISEKVMGVSLEWRKSLRASGVMRIFQSLDEAVESILRAVEGGIENIQAGQIVPIARVLPLIVNGMAGSIDEILDLLFDYSPELAKDREWIMANAYNDDAVRAFIEVLKLNFPISALWNLLGSRAQPTSTNLPSRNGANHGTKKDLARSKSR